MRRTLRFALVVVCISVSAVSVWQGSAAQESARDGISIERLESLTAEACGRCHEEHLSDFACSAHARSWDNPLFQDEWAGSGDPFCVPCHAPRTASPWAEPALASAGVDCVACHVREGAVLNTSVSGDAPHASRADPALGTVSACAGCHQVDAPHRPGTALQDTVEEWRAAGEPTGSCQGCHMEPLDGRHRHDAPGGHDEALLGRALRIEVRATPDGWNTRVDFTLEADQLGHAMPTGDIFRRLVIRATGTQDPTTEARIELGRHGVQSAAAEQRDDRVPPPGGGARQVALHVPGRSGEVRWAIELWFMPMSRAARSGLPSEVLYQTVAEGSVSIE